MSEWILVFYLATYGAGGPGTIDKLPTEAACHATYKQLKAAFKSQLLMEYACVHRPTP